MSTTRVTRLMAQRMREEKEVQYAEAVQEQRENRSVLMMKFIVLNVATCIAYPAILYFVYREIIAGNYGRALGEIVTVAGLTHVGINCLFKKENELDNRVAQLHKQLRSQG